MVLTGDSCLVANFLRLYFPGLRPDGWHFLVCYLVSVLITNVALSYGKSRERHHIPQIWRGECKTRAVVAWRIVFDDYLTSVWKACGNKTVGLGI